MSAATGYSWRQQASWAGPIFHIALFLIRTRPSYNLTAQSLPGYFCPIVWGEVGQVFVAQPRVTAVDLHVADVAHHAGVRAGYVSKKLLPYEPSLRTRQEDGYHIRFEQQSFELNP